VYGHETFKFVNKAVNQFLCLRRTLKRADWAYQKPSSGREAIGTLNFVTWSVYVWYTVRRHVERWAKLPPHCT